MLACVRAYNDFLVEWARADPQRLDAGAGDAVLGRAARRCARSSAAPRIGHRAIALLRPAADWSASRRSAHRHWDPVWAAARDTGLSVSFHIGAGDLAADPQRRQRHRRPATNFSRANRPLYFMQNAQLHLRPDLRRRLPPLPRGCASSRSRAASAGSTSSSRASTGSGRTAARAASTRSTTCCRASTSAARSTAASGSSASRHPRRHRALPRQPAVGDRLPASDLHGAGPGDDRHAAARVRRATALAAIAESEPAQGAARQRRGALPGQLSTAACRPRPLGRCARPASSTSPPASPAPTARKLFADAGADVIKVETGRRRPAAPLVGDAAPISAARTRRSSGSSHVSKRSVVLAPGSPAVAAALARRGPRHRGTPTPPGSMPATVSRQLPAPGAGVDLAVRARPARGPSGRRPTSRCRPSAARSARRGLPGGEPFQAGGRITEWLAGTYAAVAALAALRRVRRGGDGEHVDLSLLEAHGARHDQLHVGALADARAAGGAARAAHADGGDAVDRADARRLRRLLHQLAAAVRRLPAADRAAGAARRRGAGAGRRSPGPLRRVERRWSTTGR